MTHFNVHYRANMVLPVIIFALGSGLAHGQLTWSKGTVYTWATSLKCSPAQSTTLVSTTSIAVGALDVIGFDTSNGAQVRYYAANGKTNQQWDITKAADGSFKFVSVATGKCLDGYGQATGQTLRQYDCTTGTALNQKVYLEYVTYVPSCNTQWSTYRLRFAASNAANCLTQQTDGNTVFKPCLSNKADASQNFFLQNGATPGTSSPPPPPPPPSTPGPPPTAAARYNVNSLQPFPLRGTGLGANVWPGDTSVEVLYSQLKLSLIRLWVEFYPDNVISCSSSPTLGQLQQVWSGWYPNNFVNSAKTATKYGAEVMAMNKKLPGNWMNTGTNGAIKPECEKYVGIWWVAGLQKMISAGATVRWIELFNEPNYYGDIFLSTDSYARVVNIVWNALQANGLSSVGIVGPGQSALAANDPYIAACGGCLLSAWSSHTYEYGSTERGSSAGFRQVFSQSIALAWSLKSNIPFFVTEYGTKQWNWHGKYWTDYQHDLDTYSDTKPYWARTIANMINMFNAGVSSVDLWEAADQSWANSGDSWGIIRRYDGYKKKGFYALQTIFPFIPPGASILKYSAVDSQLATAVFVKDKTLVILIANDIDNEKVATVSVANVKLSSATPAIFSTWTYANQDAAIKSSLSTNTNGGLYISVRTFVDSVITLTYNLA